jgi:Fe2+ transport system protein FeoA
MMPLNLLQRGEQAEILVIRGGFHVQQRLESMGFVPGTHVEMVTNQMDGPVIINVKDSRVAVGRGLLHHIYVQPIAEHAAPAAHPMRRLRHRHRGHEFRS